jgi:dTDP-4-dehydrorhamnose 3,5-epimerase
MHYQIEPFSEAKLVTCLSGSICDVVVDLRPDSATYRHWLAVEISARCLRSMLYIRQNFAHGFQTLEDDTEVLYQMSEFYIISSRPGACGGMIQHLASSGPASSPSSPKVTGASRISSNERDS